MTIRLHKRALPRSMDDPPREVTVALTRLPDAFGQMGPNSAAANLNKWTMDVRRY